MGCAPMPSIGRVCSERIATFVRQENAICCILANRERVLLPLFVASHIAIGDEITFPIPDQEAVGPELVIKKTRSVRRTCLYLAPIGYITPPKLDKRHQGFVSAAVRDGNLGVSWVFLGCETLRDYFYCISTEERAPERGTLYKTLHVGASASLAEIRVAFKLRSLELKTVGVALAEHVKLERAFNILAHPELRAHYDSLLGDLDVPAIFPYGGFGSLLVTGERSRDGQTFFARRILAFLPEQRHRHFHLPLRNCDFYADKAVCRDVRGHLEFWVDPVLLHVAWDPSWNRWKHLLSSKLEVDGVFVRSGKYKKRDRNWDLVDWETALPSRLSVKLPTDFEHDIERARNTYSLFGRYSRALDQIRLCLEHKAIERKDLVRMCSELRIPGDFDIAQISWRPDYDPFFYRELSRHARRTYLFRDEYIFEVEKAVVIETPQLGHATYVFTKPRNMDSFLILYTKTAKSDIRKNHDNIAERLGFLTRVVHGANLRAWLREVRQRVGDETFSGREQIQAVNL